MHPYIDNCSCLTLQNSVPFPGNEKYRLRYYHIARLRNRVSNDPELPMALAAKRGRSTVFGTSTLRGPLSISGDFPHASTVKSGI